MKPADIGTPRNRAKGWHPYPASHAFQLRIIVLVAAAISFIFHADAQPQQKNSIFEMLPDVNALGPAWDCKVYLMFDSQAAPTEVVETVKPPPESALKEWRRGMRDPRGKISGWVLAHYNLVSSNTGPKYETHLERYRNQDTLVADFDTTLKTLDAKPGSRMLQNIGDAAILETNPDGACTKVWFRRGDYRVWISPIGTPHNWDHAPAMRLLAQAIDQRIVSVALDSHGAADGAALLKQALQEASSSSPPGSTTPRQVARIGNAFFPLTRPPSPNAVAIAFDHWGKQGWQTDPLAVFRLTNSDSHSIILWNVRVQHATTNITTEPSGWETIQDDYPSATSAVCEAGSSIEFWVNKPAMSPWRACILYSRELPESERPKNSQRTWGRNYEVIGQPVQ